MTGNELPYIAQAHQNMVLAGDGIFTKNCQTWLEKRIGCNKALLTHSCTAALEMSAMLAEIGPGDEIIMPSYTFVSTANAFALRGAKPIFIDIRPDTLNINENLIESAITQRTKAIVPVHYAGIACEMKKIFEIANLYNLIIIEDAAQGILSSYQDKLLGSLGHLGCLSFHETKNIISGEGGALLINDPKLVERAEIIREKGTNRSNYFRGQVDKYSWVDLGSSYLPSEIIAAFLFAQLEEADKITNERMKLWKKYHEAFKHLEENGRLRRPVIPADNVHNAHMYYLLLKNIDERTLFIEKLKLNGINCVFHYIPLHNSSYGRKVGKAVGNLSITEDIADRLVRIPLWLGMGTKQEKVIEKIIDFFK
jgi:dTDP-4-amino-4,6-dideoxygalactose transaminase